MAQNNLSDFARWAYGKLTSHPISQIEQTLNTGKPPSKRESYPSNSVQAAPSIASSRSTGDSFKRYGPAAPAGKWSKAAAGKNAPKRRSFTSSLKEGK